MLISERIEHRHIDDLTPHPRNDEFHSKHEEEEYVLLKTSIEQDGIQEAIWVTVDDMILSGHARWKIARELGMEDLPVRVVEDATEEDMLYLLIQANEARRGDEKDPMKKARKLKVLHHRWLSQKDESQAGTLVDQSDMMKLAGSKSGFYRLLKLNDLIPELQEMVSQGKIGQQAGNELADLDSEEQRAVFDTIAVSGVKKVRVDEIKAICEERENPNREPLPNIKIPNIETNVESDSQNESSQEVSEDNRSTTLAAISQALPEEDAKRVKQKIFLNRAKVFHRKIESFAKELQTIDSIETEEAKQLVGDLVIRLQDILNKITTLK